VGKGEGLRIALEKRIADIKKCVVDQVEDVLEWTEITFDPIIDFSRYLMDDLLTGLSFLLSLISTICCKTLVIKYLLEN
jgi:hypothetical protein